MFGFGLKSKLPDYEMMEKVAELDALERRRKSEAEASPLAKEIARMLREEPEKWTATDSLTMAHGGGLKLTSYISGVTYVGVTMTAEMGGRLVSLSPNDVSLLGYAKGEWSAWRNKKHAEDILADLRGSKDGAPLLLDHGP